MRAHHAIAVVAIILIGLGLKLTFFSAPPAEADARSVESLHIDVSQLQLGAPIFQPQDQFVHERGGVLARIGDEDLEFLSCANVRHGYPTWPKSVARRHKNRMRSSSATAKLVRQFEAALGHSRHSRYPGVSGSPRERSVFWAARPPRFCRRAI